MTDDELLHAFEKARQEIPSYNPVFLQFNDQQELERGVTILKTMNVIILHKYILLPLVLIDGLTPEKMKIIAKRCSIVNVHPNKIRTLIKPSEDSISHFQDDNSLNSSRLPEIIGTTKLLEEGHDGTGIIIAILDTGVDATHPDLTNKVVHETSFVKHNLGYLEDEDPKDTFGHGTAVAGTAAGTGKASNGLYTGIAPGANFWNVKVLNSLGVGRDAGIIAGIEYATFGPDNQRDPSDPDIINLSLGGPGGPDDLSSLAVDAAVTQGVVVTASAGNEGPFYSSVGSPGAARLAITVGATTLNGELTKFSSRGFNLGRYPDPDIVAPGLDIIAPLSATSFLGLSKQILYPPKYISGKDGNYVPLSGTSLSSPIVAGACALLLEAFPRLKELGPIALRIVLMRTANSTHPSFQANPNIAGAGMLDIAKAETYLENLDDTPTQDLVLVFPKLLLSEPALVAFPGNSLEEKILLLTVAPATFTFETEGPIKPFVELVNTSLYIEQGDVLPINLTVSLPLDINPSIFEQINGFLNVLMDGKLIAHLPFQPIDVRFPKLRVYFDNFHNKGPEDTPLRNFFAVTKLLRNKSVDIVVHDSFISYETLASFDILLLPDVELMFSQKEIQAIYQFLEAGGNLILLGAEKDSMAVKAINELLDPFGITLTDTIENVTDQGVWKHHEANLNVTTFSLHPLTQGIDLLTWKAGISLTIDTEVSNTRDLATITLEENEYAVMAVHEANPVHNGSVIVLGTEYLFYDDLLNETDSTNRQLAENLFDWLTPDSDLLPRIMINRTRAAPMDTISVVTYIITSETSDLAAVEDLNLIVTFPNGTETLLTNELAQPPYEIIPGIYHYTYTLPTDLSGYLTFKINSSQFEENPSTTVLVSETEPKIVSTEMVVETGGREIVEPNWTIFFDEPKLDRYDDKITIEATIQHADQVTLYLTLLGDQLSDLSKETTANYAFPMVVGSNSQHWRYEWHPNSSTPAGMYSYFVFPTTKDGTFSLTPYNSTGTFILLDSEPIIDETNTFVAKHSIQELEDLLDRERISVLSSPTVNIKITGEDLEDTLNEMEAWVLVLEFSVFIIEEYVLAVSSIPYNTQTKMFEMNFTLPSNLLSTPYGQLPEDTILVFYLLLRDSDGNFDYAIAPTALQLPTELLFRQTIDSIIALGLILIGSIFFLEPIIGTIVVLVASILIAWQLAKRSLRQLQ
ncbi:MAG: DUF4350 domain-containing protein [Candidatus Heimdallarchaeota archaeon]